MASANTPKPLSSKAPLRSSPGASAQDHGDLAVLNLDDMGVIQDGSHACTQIFGYPLAELVGKHVSLLLPDLPHAGLVSDGRILPRLAYLCRCGVAFQARHRSGTRFASELFVNRLDCHNVVMLVRCLGSPPQAGLGEAVH